MEDCRVSLSGGAESFAVETDRIWMDRLVALLGGPATVAGRGREGLRARTILGERGSTYIGVLVV
jgi:hypothetical protein